MQYSCLKVSSLGVYGIYINGHRTKQKFTFCFYEGVLVTGTANWDASLTIVCMLLMSVLCTSLI